MKIKETCKKEKRKRYEENIKKETEKKRHMEEEDEKLKEKSKKGI
jgi:hypothetical protein